MKLLVDMNLTPEWVPFLAAAGIDVVHWSSVGDGRAKDEVLMQWAASEARIVFTNDLDSARCSLLRALAGRAWCRFALWIWCPRRSVATCFASFTTTPKRWPRVPS